MMPTLLCAVLFIPQVLCNLDDPWFKQWKATDTYTASDGWVNRLPIRLASTESILYGSADMLAVMSHINAAGDDVVPVSVGGRAVVSVWFNNFTDSDCGGAYLETWYTLFVTEKKDPPLNLPFDSPMSLLVAAPTAKVYLVRVICGDAPGAAGNAAHAIWGGREIWGFSKSPTVAQIRYIYTGPNNTFTQFDASHGGKPAVSMKMKLPETNPNVIKVPSEARTPADAAISSPKSLVMQTRYGQAFKATQYIAPWDETTDSLHIYADESWYGATLSAWDFQPKLKVHSTDFKIVAFKPAGWGSPAALQHTQSVETDA